MKHLHLSKQVIFYKMLHWNFKYCRVQIEENVSYWINVKQSVSNHASLCHVLRFFIVFPMAINKPFGIQLDLAWEPGNGKQNMYFVFISKTRYKLVFRDNVKITRKEPLKLFLCDYPASSRNAEKRLLNPEDSIQSRKKWWTLITMRNI